MADTRDFNMVPDVGLECSGSSEGSSVMFNLTNFNFKYNSNLLNNINYYNYYTLYPFSKGKRNLY